MIDIHCHLLYGVDDGAKDKQESIEMLKRAKEQGVDAIILTPHYRHGMFPYRIDEIEYNFSTIKEYANQIGIKLYLGTEYHVNSEIVENFRKGRCHTLGNTKYILTEYSHDTEFGYIRKMTNEVIANGFIPVIVHVERYACMIENIDNAGELRNMGAWIQSNADAVLGLEGYRTKKYCKKLLKNGWCDVIASDSHGINRRVCNMQKCLAYVGKKFGEAYADRLFTDNPKKIIDTIR